MRVWSPDPLLIEVCRDDSVIIITLVSGVCLAANRYNP